MPSSPRPLYRSPLIWPRGRRFADLRLFVVLDSDFLRGITALARHVIQIELKAQQLFQPHQATRQVEALLRRALVAEFALRLPSRLVRAQTLFFQPIGLRCKMRLNLG
jgi:hypothetical protein